MSDFNCGDSGVALQFTPQSAIPGSATGITFTFKGIQTGTRVQVSATYQNSGAYAQYITTGSDFTIPDQYLWELLYSVSGNSLSSVAPFPIITVGSRL